MDTLSGLKRVASHLFVQLVCSYLPPVDSIYISESYLNLSIKGWFFKRALIYLAQETQSRKIVEVCRQNKNVNSFLGGRKEAG